MLKRCTKCGVEKVLEDFCHNKTCKNEREGLCKECAREYHAQYYKANRKEILNLAREHRETHKECVLAWQRNYRKAHRKKIRENDRKYYAVRAKKIKESSAEDRKAYRKIVNEQQCARRKTPNGRLNMINALHKRRTSEKKTKATLSVQQWNKILQMQNSQCNICKKKFTIKQPPTFDHIIPLSKGGTLVFENVQALCRSCNCSKGAKLNTQFIQTWGL